MNDSEFSPELNTQLSSELGDRLSLDQLHDIVAAEPSSWWPLPYGWWFVIALGVAFAFSFFCYLLLNWRVTAYKRIAGRELQHAKDATQISEILKRAALTVYPREEIASLSGLRWHEWLRDLTNSSDTNHAFRDHSLRTDKSVTPAFTIEFAQSCLRAMPARRPQQPVSSSKVKSRIDSQRQVSGA